MYSLETLGKHLLDQWIS